MNPFQTIPYYPEFKFPSQAASVNNEVRVRVPYSIAIYGIAIQATKPPETDYYEYFLQFQNFETGDTLFDEPIQAFNIQSDCRGYVPTLGLAQSQGGGWRLPSLWYIEKNQTIVCTLSTFVDSVTESYYITLLGYTVDGDPNPGVQPFVYSYPMRLGFQDNVEGGGGQTSVNFNQQIVNTLAKPMIHNFELHTIVLDPWGTGGLDTSSRFSLQVSWPGKKLFDRLVFDGIAGGGTAFAQNGQVGPSSSNAFPFPDQNVIQYRLSRPEFICKGTMVRVDISPAPTYLNSDEVHSAFNEECCMALIGNHLG